MADDPTGSATRVLVVDDSDDQRELLGALHQGRMRHRAG